MAVFEVEGGLAAGPAGFAAGAVCVRSAAGPEVCLGAELGTLGSGFPGEFAGGWACVGEAGPASCAGGAFGALGCQGRGVDRVSA